MALFANIKVILRDMFKKQATLEYALDEKVNDPLVRGHIENEIEKCIFCGMCQRKCPTGAIEVSRDSKEWSIQRFSCIQCGCCTEVCPKKCLHMDNRLPKVSIEKTKDVVSLARVSGDQTNNTNS